MNRLVRLREAVSEGGSGEGGRERSDAMEDEEGSRRCKDT